MPIKIVGKDKGYVQWGSRGKKYTFNSLTSFKQAYKKAVAQSRAAHAHGYRGK